RGDGKNRYSKKTQFQEVPQKKFSLPAWTPPVPIRLHDWGRSPSEQIPAGLHAAGYLIRGASTSNATFCPAARKRTTVRRTRDSEPPERERSGHLEGCRRPIPCLRRYTAC